ncbi:carbohydate-binding domain-containing protein [Pseudoalteromonas sp. MMG013]|uniref:family 20 glycosylhydrolase n=1 Tax=Pseudoalteromonas sp. MMG013 TaxID=2822687 RepID=UPI001B37408F|nr:family 20 glycosylhydrolase [Pseudoalteromonas sp. MMG013]MBQ4864026.1 carbohydate-binding domain-containing protein [Pseudoalteromonas sp. MMG013]
MYKYVLGLLACAISVNVFAMNQPQLDSMAKDLKVIYTLLDANSACPAKVQQCYLSELSLTLPYDLKSHNWAIYFSQLMPIIHSSNSEFEITHINGDLHRLSPSKMFSGFAGGDAHRIRFYTQDSQITRSEFMPNYILADSEGVLSAKVIASTIPTVDPETGLEAQPYLAPFNTMSQLRIHERDKTPWMGTKYLFENALRPVLTEAPIDIIPKPETLILSSEPMVSIQNGIKLSLVNIKREGISQALFRLSTLGIHEQEQGFNVNVKRTTTATLAEQAYTLKISAQAVNIEAATEQGAFYALQSLIGLLNIETHTLPQVDITDAPHYMFRGLHIDSARNFRSKQFILETITHMASYKLNRLHLHLADDEGWRLEIAGLPELTEVGATRCFDLSEQRCLLPQLGAGNAPDASINGFYSRQDYIDILQHAKRHHVEVIPSLDMPGHSRAAIVSMEARFERLMAQNLERDALKYRLVEPQDLTRYRSIQHYSDNTLNVCLEQTYQFIDKVLTEVQALHEAAEVPLKTYHIGADETAGAWLNSPACSLLKYSEPSLNGYFIERISKIVTDKGVAVAGWSDGLDDVRVKNMPHVVQSNVWGTLAHGGHQVAHRHINRNWKVIVSNPDVTYFDFPYESHPMERGNHWATRAVNTRKFFEFMPDNLPAHAELWHNNYARSYIADDTSSRLEKGVNAKGIQGHLWSEMIRTDEQAEYMLYPRLLALAERAWHKPDWALRYKESRSFDKNTTFMTKGALQAREKDWQRFIALVGFKEIPKLASQGVFYRLPSVAAGKSESGQLMVFTEIPGFDIEVKTLNGWQAVSPKMLHSTALAVRAKLGRRVGRALPVSDHVLE